MFVVFVCYIVVSLVIYVMNESVYIFPWFGDKIIQISGPIASFLWPVGFAISIWTDFIRKDT